jgi:exosortase H (IPTLxxWG-CTERM-specific)
VAGGGRSSLGALERVRAEEGRFGATFFAIAAALFSLYYFPYGTRDGFSARCFSAWLRVYTDVTAAALSMFDHDVSASGNSVMGRSFSMQIVKSCDAMEANILFVSAMLAFPAPWRRKTAALGFGLVALVAMNVLRLCSLFWIGSTFRAGFDFVHYDAWPLLLVVFAAADFLVCARWARAATRFRAPAAPNAVCSS